MTDFSSILKELKAGKRVSRSGWNGKGMWLVLVHNWNANFSGSLPPDWSALPFIAMKTVDDAMVPWPASQTDILADDWGVV